MMSGEARTLRRVMRDVKAGERSGKPCVIALAITEPGAGTDVEEIEHLLDKAKVRCLAKRVPGGYVLNGTKIFISMGHLAEWVVVYGYTDLKHPADTMVAMMVKTDMPGFSVGRHEDKMGQRACPASVLNFEDCFVPDELVILDADRIRTATSLPARDVWMRHIDYIVSITRPVVAAFGTAAGRGAFEATCAYVAATELEGRAMINHEWVQCRLSEMYRNVRLGQLVYAEANNANGHRGVYNLLQMWPVYSFLRYTPRWAFDKVISPLLSNRLGSWLLRKWYLDWQKSKDQNLCTGLGSLAKFTATELGLQNCQMALEVMGQAGLRHDNGVEKILRDAKLLQIYEGTNQLNRLNVFKGLVAPNIAQAIPYAD
jgi:alkylation response protein AidB-like acyl-CoA dehydrogenase